jgi:hypothetical protein
VALVGSGGWRIEQITLTRDGIARTLLRVRRHGYFIADVRSVGELAALGVDLATLTEEDQPGDQPGG